MDDHRSVRFLWFMYNESEEFLVQMCEVSIEVYCYISEWNRLPLECSWLRSFIIVFLKNSSESFMVKDNSTIDQIVSVE